MALFSFLLITDLGFNLINIYIYIYILQNKSTRIITKLYGYNGPVCILLLLLLI